MKKDIKSKNKNKKKNNISLSKIFLIIFIVVVLVVGIYFFLTAEDEESRLTLLEKQWIEKNKNTLINMEIPNNLTVLASDGSGILFNFIEEIEKEYELSFNKVSYNYPNGLESNDYGFKVLNNSNKLTKDDIFVTEDNFVLVGANEEIIEDVYSLSGSSIGVLETDKDTFNRIYENTNINFRSFSTIDNLFKSLNEKMVDYIIVPRYASLDRIVSNDYYIKYNFSNISNKIVLRLGKNQRLNNILTKLLNDWKENTYRDDLEVSLMNFYSKNFDVTDVDKRSLVSKVYTYGYVKGSSYNQYKNNELYGLAGEYVNTLSTMSSMEFKVVEYSNNKKLIDAIKNKEVDIAFIDFEYKDEENSNLLSTYSNFVSNMVVLSKNFESISDKNGLINRKLYLLNDNYLYSYVSNSINSYINTIKKVDQKIDDDGLLVLDELEYSNNNNNQKISDYNLVFYDSYSSDYHYVINNSDKVLFDLFNFVLQNTNYNEYKNISINNLNKTYSSEYNFKYIYMVIVAIILVPIIILVIVIFSMKSASKFKLSRKEDILKYNDMLTSLKNRNYLNAHMDDWDDMDVYPRTIIVADLNKLKYVNDNYGIGEGNDLIKKAAAILINTQLEKSEIIRTAGNEFLIYLIGYNKNQINTYISKLSKEFEKLPHGFGAAIGYSMIEDEIKTVEDAINEASISMRNDKEQNYK